MKFLHTSDWHLGRSLYGKKRYEEFAAFLDWLIQTIEQEQIDVLLVAGDVFDTSTPSNRAQELYYRFLCRVAASCCRYVIVIAGNHDSPSFLNAPRELLRALNVYVVGAIPQSPEDEVIVLTNGQTPEAIICAVPYLRDRDIRTAAPGETIDEKNAKLVEGLKTHYAHVCGIAESRRTEFEKAGYKDIPIIAMGHLFTAGGRTIDGDGVRELYVGSLVHVGRDVFPDSIDYLALGHLHVAQTVGQADHIRYSGAPIPMGFGEANQAKQVVVVAFKGTKPTVSTMAVPCFQQLIRIVGDLDHIRDRMDALKDQKSQAWLEIEYTGQQVVGDLRELIEEALTGTSMEIRRIKNRQLMNRVMQTMNPEETLDDLDANDVFVRCLDTFDVPEADRPELIASYNEIVQSLHEDDKHAE